MNISDTNLPKHPGLFLIIKKLYEVKALKAARWYIKTAKKIACLCQHLAFNQRCTCYHILPRYLYQKPLVPSADGYKIACSTGFKYLSAKIKQLLQTMSTKTWPIFPTAQTAIHSQPLPSGLFKRNRVHNPSVSKRSHQ